ncbi:MAG: NAD-dependent epimerase/dehydratase family protein [Actinomycetota bacterium]|nr:NAD-dependent epimerase/dehydratase family protein [Actinomycetota bacterium]
MSSAGTPVKRERVVVVTGAGGLVGSTACRSYAGRGDLVVGIDNDLRARFFGDEASTRWATDQLIADFPNYRHADLDIRDATAVERLFADYSTDIKLIVHAAAQPSHDWAAREPVTDFTINAMGTLYLLEAARRWCPHSVLIFTSTNKVYGDRPNSLPLREFDTRWEIEPDHPYSDHGIDENMSIDATKHSVFGSSKVAADILVQEYARYFGLSTAVLRAGCLTGPAHSGARLHGFLAYLMKCVVMDTPYRVYGYKAKQVRDNLHSEDLVAAFDEIYRAPRPGEVYNIGGGRFSNCSMIEAISLSEKFAGKRLRWSYDENARSGDHVWWISDTRKFRSHYPTWSPTRSIEEILRGIHSEGMARW